jgi:hypothetical protein
MTSLKLLCLAAAIAVSAMFGIATYDSAMADSAAVTNYKQAVTKRVAAWSTRMDKLNDDLTKAKAELALLSGPNPPIPTNDPQAAIKVIQGKIKGIQDTMTYETTSLQIDIAQMTVSTSDKSETIPLPGFISDIVKAKGLPLNKNVSFTPNFKWNWSSGTLGSAGGTIRVVFQNP